MNDNNLKLYNRISESRYDKYDISKKTNSESSDDKNWYFSGIYGEAEVESGNNNERFYREKPFKLETARYVSEEINYNVGNKAVGAAEHPLIDDPFYTKVTFESTAHCIQSLEWKGKVLYGKTKILQHLPKGALIVGFIKSEIPLGISLRALAHLTVDKIRNLKVVEDLHIICWDIVRNPGFETAYMDAVLESKYDILESIDKAYIVETENNLNKFSKSLDNLPIRGRELYMQNQCKKFLSIYDI